MLKRKYTHIVTSQSHEKHPDTEGNNAAQEKQSVPWLLIGLGNGQGYHDTRHNIGQDIIDELARRYCNESLLTYTSILKSPASSSSSQQRKKKQRQIYDDNDDNNLRDDVNDTNHYDVYKAHNCIYIPNVTFDFTNTPKLGKGRTDNNSTTTRTHSHSSSRSISNGNSKDIDIEGGIVTDTDISIRNNESKNNKDEKNGSKIIDTRNSNTYTDTEGLDTSITTSSPPSIYLIICNTYMNNSGKALLSLLRHISATLHLPIHQLIKQTIILYDEVQWNVGTFKVKKNVSAGEHNGVASILSCLQQAKISPRFIRIKIGIGESSPHPSFSSSTRHTTALHEYVLSKFSAEQNDLMRQQHLVDSVIDCIHSIILNSADLAMNIYNQNSNGAMIEQRQTMKVNGRVKQGSVESEVKG